MIYIDRRKDQEEGRRNREEETKKFCRFNELVSHGKAGLKDWDKDRVTFQVAYRMRSI